MSYTFRKTELRLGNQINAIKTYAGLGLEKSIVFELRLITVEAADINLLDNSYSLFSTMFQPIPIDTILLEKIGLKYKTGLGYMHESCQIYTLRKAENGYYIFNIIDNPVAIRQVEYLHQVQNFFTDNVGVDLIF